MSRSRFMSRSLVGALGALLLAAACLRLVGAAQADSQDFHVYFRAVHAWLGGTSPYLVDPSLMGFVYKYPPWMLPLLAPLTLGNLPFEMARVFWALGELLALSYCARWLICHKAQPRFVALTLALYWYLWLAHFYSGQITLFLLAASLWALDAPARRTTALFTLLSTKIFTLFPLIGMWRTFFPKKNVARTLMWSAFTFVLLHFALWRVAYAAGGAPFNPFAYLVDLYRQWAAAAGSGAAELGAHVVRGPGNHGFPAAILRALDPTGLHLSLDVGLSLSMALVLGMLWSEASRHLNSVEKWSGWLALGVVIHPLAWHHSYVMALPLSTYAFQAAHERKHSAGNQKTWMLLAFLGTALITLIVPPVFGTQWVKIPEALANKSWGVVLLAWVLVRCRPTPTHPTQRGRS